MVTVAVQFDWDDANRDHIAQHGITPEAAEQVMLNEPLEWERQTRNNEERMQYLGETDFGRVLFVVTTIREDKLRVVTAWSAKEKWARL